MKKSGSGTRVFCPEEEGGNLCLVPAEKVVVRLWGGCSMVSREEKGQTWEAGKGPLGWGHPRFQGRHRVAALFAPQVQCMSRHHNSY